jgi:hypothetical protein
VVSVIWLTLLVTRILQNPVHTVTNAMLILNSILLICSTNVVGMVSVDWHLNKLETASGVV